MPLNVIDLPKEQNRLAQISQAVSEVELFIVGKPINSVRIKDASIDTANIVNLTITAAKFENLSITNAKIDTIDAAKFTTGTLSADRISTGSLTVDKLNVTELSAITVNVGTVTAGSITGGTITGGTVRTESSGTRVEMTASPNAMILYDGSTERFRMDPDGFKLNNVGLYWMNDAVDTFYCSHFRSGNDVYIQSGSNLDFNVIQGTSGGDIQIVAADGEVSAIANGGTTYVNGSVKTAIVPSSSGYRSLFCLESPEVWFFDFAKDETSIDPDFLKVTTGESNILKTDQGELLVFRKRKDTEKVRFESKTLEQFDKNNHFWGSV